VRVNNQRSNQPIETGKKEARKRKKTEPIVMAENLLQSKGKKNAKIY